MSLAKPAALNDLLGNPGKRHRGPEPEPMKGAPRPPAWMSKEARAEWRRVVPALDRIGMLALVDRTALVLYCEAWATYVQAIATVRAEGETIMGYRGSTVRHPSAIVAKDATATIRAFCGEFGLTPSARARMTLPGQSPEADMEGLLSGD